MKNLDIGFEVDADIIGGRRIEGDANASDPDSARAIGVENAEFGNATDGFLVDLNRGRDTIEGAATAEAGEEAFADGIRNKGEIDLGNGFDLLKGTGSATTTGNGQATIATGINSTDRGVIKTGNGDDILEGEANATGQDNVGAFAVLVTNVDTGKNDDTIKGTATANGVTTTDARGVSVGFSDIDDDTIANPEFADEPPTISGTPEVGNLITGNGNDTIEGEAKVIVEAQNGDEIFFAGANGIVNDGGSIQQLETLLATIGKDLTNFTGEDVEQIIDQLETSTIDTGFNDDALIANVELNVSQVGEGADSDLEVIGDGIENAGQLLLGAGNDSVNSTVSVTTTISGAKGLADALDNSSVGIITGLNLETNNQTLFDLGLGDDTFTSNVFATAVDDLSAADGLGNRGVFVAGGGNDTFNLTSVSEFVLKNENDNEQQEGIADGWENRSRVFLDDPEGKTRGNDSVTTSATASGEGVLTIAEGLETREFFDAGRGDDSFNLNGLATTGVGALADNLTQAAGLQTEQIDSGEFLLGTGDNSVIGNATAKSKAVAGLDDDGGEFTPSTFAFGITQMTADANNANDVGEFLAGNGNDTLEGTSEATGEQDVAAFGLLFSNANLGNGLNSLKGNATAQSKVSALATGISVGTDDVFLKTNSLDREYGLAAEAGILRTGADKDLIEGVANVTANGNALIDSEANGILVEKGSTFNTNNGADTVKGTAKASSIGTSADSGFAVLADGIENKGTFNTGAGDDKIVAEAEAESINNAAITNALSNVGDFLTRSGADSITATAVSKASGTNGDTAIADAIDNRGVLKTGGGDDKIIATATAHAKNGSASANAINQNEEAGSQINLGNGNDMIVAEASAFSDGDINAIAIFGGTINAGNGADNIRARSNDNLIGSNGKFELDGGQGFGGDVKLNMGAGNDTLLGFGDGIANGGAGIDTLQFEFSLRDFIHGGGSIELSKNSAIFTFGDVTYETRNFELVQFNANFENDSVADEFTLALGVSNGVSASLELADALQFTKEFNSPEDLVQFVEQFEAQSRII